MNWKIDDKWITPAAGGWMISGDQESHVLEGGKWHDITQARRVELKGEGYPHIKKAVYYTSKSISYENSLTSARILFLVFHGTWGAETKAYYDVDSKSFQAILDYAKSLGNSVEVVSVGWTGDDNDQARQDAARYVKDIFEKLYGKSNIFTQVDLLAHSHGGNLINLLTNADYLYGKIHNMFSINTPIREDYKVNLDALSGKLYNFYSTADLIQYAGSSKRSDSRYPEGTSWWEAVFVNPFSNIHFVGGRKVTEVSEAKEVFEPKALNYRVQVDGISPGHSYTEPVLHCLGKIVSETNEHYHYNSDFDLNIDSQGCTIELVIRQKYSDSALENASSQVKAKLDKEWNYSAAQWWKYYGKHKGDIKSKAPFAETVAAMLWGHSAIKQSPAGPFEGSKEEEKEEEE